MSDQFALGAEVDAEIAARVAARGFDLFCVADPPPGARLVHVGGRWQELLGHRPDDLTGTSVFDLVHPDDLVRVVNEVDRVEAGGGLVPTFDVRLQAADGRVVWTRWSRVVDERTGRLYAAARDVTAEHLAEAQLRFMYDLVERTRAATASIEALEVAIRIICELQDWAYGEVWMPEGQHLRAVGSYVRDGDLVALADRSRSVRLSQAQGLPGIAWAERRLVFSANVLDHEMFERRQWPEADGLQGSVAIPVTVDDDVVAVLMFMDRDPLPWDAALGQVLRSATEHLSLVLHRLGLLEASEREVRSLESSVGDLQSFVITISHDVRSPLRMMEMRLDDLMEDADVELEPRVRTAIERTRADAGRLVSLVDHLLAYSWAESQDLATELVDVEGLVHDVAMGIPGLSEGRVAFHVGALPEARADAGLLRLAFANLLQNAVKYSAIRDAPEVRVTACRVEGECVYSVADNGPGFDPAQAERIFGMFERNVSRDVEGSGVGLAIVQRVAERHGGRVWGHSEPGRSATFSIAIPDLVPGGVDAATPERPIAEPASMEPGPGLVTKAGGPKR